MQSQEMQMYEVESILAMKSSASDQTKRQFKIKWKGYSIQQSTWEPQENLTSCQRILQEFIQKQPKISMKKPSLPIQDQVAANPIQTFSIKVKETKINHEDLYFEDEQIDLAKQKASSKNSDSISQKKIGKTRGRPRKSKITQQQQQSQKKEKKQSQKSPQGLQKGIQQQQNILEEVRIKIKQKMFLSAAKQKSNDNALIKQMESSFIQNGSQTQIIPSKNTKILAMHYQEHQPFPFFIIAINQKMETLTYHEVYYSYPLALAQFYSNFIQIHPSKATDRDIKKRQKGIGQMTKLKKNLHKKDKKDKGGQVFNRRNKQRMQQNQLQQVQEEMNSSQQDCQQNEQEQQKRQEKKVRQMEQKVDFLRTDNCKILVQQFSEEQQ